MASFAPAFQDFQGTSKSAPGLTAPSDHMEHYLHFPVICLVPIGLEVGDPSFYDEHKNTNAELF
jgi:hypothetical protein